MLTIIPRLFRDADHFSTQMSKLNGSDDLGSYILKLVEEKEIATPNIAATARSNGNGSNGVTENVAPSESTSETNTEAVPRTSNS